MASKMDSKSTKHLILPAVSFSWWLVFPNSKGIRQSIWFLPYFPLTPNSLNKSGCVLKPVWNAMWTLKTSYLLNINNRKTNPVPGWSLKGSSEPCREALSLAQTHYITFKWQQRVHAEPGACRITNECWKKNRKSTAGRLKVKRL